MGRKVERLRFFSYVEYKRCFDFARKASASICSMFETRSGEQFLTKYGQKICLK